MQTLDFLRTILPEDCWYFVATPSRTGKGFNHVACQSVEELAHRVAHLDGQGLNVYHACSGFREEHIERPVQTKTGMETKRLYRVKENVKLVKSFWLDLDVEAGNPAKYPDQRAALISLNDMLVKTGLPKPLIVSSGYGVHVYWPLLAPVLPGQWRATALQLKALCHGVGLIADPVRTADESSVLRPIGTTNRKRADGSTQPVRLLYPLEGQPVVATDHQVLYATIIRAMETNKVEMVDTDKSKTLRSNPEDLIVPVGGYQKVSAEKVADRCNQIKLFRDTGGVSEPHWYHALQIMQHTIEGEPQGHAWSKTYSSYTEGETDQKLSQVRGMGPTLCSKFKDVNPDGCKNCPFAGKITTPVQLGMVVQEAPAPVVKEMVDGKEREITLPSPPWPFKRGAEDQPGLYVEVEAGVPVRFYPYDLYPYMIVHDAGKREGSVSVKHHLPQEGWRDFSIPLELVEHPSDFLGRMRNNFVNPENRKYMVAYMDAYLRELQDKQKIKQLHTRLGWIEDDAFLLGTKMYTKEGVRPGGVSSMVSTKIVNSYHAKGDHSKWVETMNLFDRDGLEAHLFSILVGFAAPLFKLTGHGGIVASMLGETNAGKTLSARAMASIYGNFDPFKAGKHDTLNARIERLGMLSNLPVYLDETTNIDADDVSELMYQISQGVGRTRLRSDSTVREAAEWSTIVLTSGNRSLVGRLKEAKANPEAELVRLFEFTVPKLTWFEAEMASIYDVLEVNYGSAGEKYINYLVRLDHADVRTQFRALTDAFQQDVGFDGKERFWYALVGCVLYSLWLASASGALPLKDVNVTYQRMWRWCIEQVHRQRGDVIEAKIDSAEILSRFLNSHLADRLVVMQGGGSDLVAVVKQPAAHGKLLVEYNQTTGVLRIDQTTIRNWITKNQWQPMGVRKDLMDAGVMIDHGDRDYKVTLGKGTQYTGGQTRVWEINAHHPTLEGIGATLQKDPEEAQ